MKSSTTRVLRIALAVIIIGALALFARSVNWSDTWHAITSADLSILLLAALVNIGSLALKAVRWWVFLRSVGAPSLRLALRATFAGAGLNNILVANGGEAARVMFVSGATGIPSATILATLALERLFDLMGYVILLLLAVSFLELPPALERTRPLAWVAMVGVVALWIYLVRRPEHIEQAVAVESGWWGKTRSYGKNVLRTVGGISTGPRFAAAILLSVGAWAMQVWTYALTARAAGFNLSLVGTVAALLAVNLGFALRATPGNVGVFQMMYAFIAAAFGMNKDQAIAVAFLIQTQQILPITFLAVCLAPEFLFRKKKGAK